MGKEKDRDLVWDFYKQCSHDKYLAKCVFCSREIKCTTSYNLKNHLRNKHRDVIDLSVLETPVEKRRISKDVFNTREFVFKHFSEVDTTGKQAKCNYCSNFFSYKTTVFNLREHLKRKHNVRNENEGKVEKEETSSDEDNDESSRESGLWTYFESKGSYARCTLCGLASTADDEGMLAHLKERHAEVVMEVANSENEAKSDDDMYTEVVYLEEDQESKKKRKLSKSSLFQPIKKHKNFVERRRHDSTSSDEVLLTKKRSNFKIEKNTPRYPERTKHEEKWSNVKTERSKVAESKTKNEDELEQFGSYVLSLLKTMPENVVTKLQMDIINMIMQEKLKLKQKEAETNKEVISEITVASPRLIVLNHVSDNGRSDNVRNSDGNIRNSDENVKNSEEMQNNDDGDTASVSVSLPVIEQ